MLSAMAARRWSVWHLVGAVLMGALGVWATLPAWKDILFIAMKDEEANHLFLVPVVVGWMIVARKDRLRFFTPSGTVVGPLIVAAGWFASDYGFNNAVQSMWHAGAIMVVVGCVLSIIGITALIRFFPAFLVLVFLIPVPGSIRQAIAVPLQTATAVATEALLEIGGVPVVRSANMLTINNQQVTVAEACNGMRMVFALVLVSFAFAYSMPLRNSVRLLVLAASPLAAIVCNVIRLIPTVWLYGYAEKDLAKSFHDIGGWIMLPVAFFMLLGIMRLLRWALVPVAKYNLAYQ